VQGFSGKLVLCKATGKSTPPVKTMMTEAALEEVTDRHIKLVIY
jgi:hypothetical protein